MLSPQGRKESLVDVVILRKEEKNGEGTIEKKLRERSKVSNALNVKDSSILRRNSQIERREICTKKNRRAMEAKWHDRESESTSSDDSSSQDDAKNFTTFVGPPSSPPRENSTREVEASPPMELHGLDEEIPTCVEDSDCNEDIQDVHDQLYV